MNPKYYKIIIADDHKLISDGIELIINKNNLGTVVAKVSNGQELLQVLKVQVANLIILDVQMPLLDGINTLNFLKLKKINSKVLILSQYDSIELIKQFYSIGADGYLPKSFDLEEFVLALKKIKSGEKVFPLLQQDNRNSLKRKQLVSFDIDQYKLSERELEIIVFISKGLTSKQIAHELYLSEFTITTHRRNILKKLELNNVAGLINFAKENQLI